LAFKSIATAKARILGSVHSIKLDDAPAYMPFPVPSCGTIPELPKQFIIENRPGAGGNIATEVVARAPADGSPSARTI